jgi:hypothetical protein
MGNQFSNDFATSEDEFWREYFARTRDKDVGPMATIYTDSNINKENKKRSKEILKRHTIIGKDQTKIYRLPHHLFKPYD